MAEGGEGHTAGGAQHGALKAEVGRAAFTPLSPVGLQVLSLPRDVARALSLLDLLPPPPMVARSAQERPARRRRRRRRRCPCSPRSALGGSAGMRAALLSCHCWHSPRPSAAAIAGMGWMREAGDDCGGGEGRCSVVQQKQQQRPENSPFALCV